MAVDSVRRTVERWESPAYDTVPGDQYELALAHLFGRTPSGATALGPGSDFQAYLSILEDFGTPPQRLRELTALVAEITTTAVADLGDGTISQSQARACDLKENPAPERSGGGLPQRSLHPANHAQDPATVATSTTPATQHETHPVQRRSFLTASGAAAFDTVLVVRTRVLQALEVVTSGDADTLGIAHDCLNELIAHYSDKLSVSPLSETYGDLVNVRSYAGGLLERPGASARQRTDLLVAAGRLSNLLATAASYMGDHESTLIWCVDAERHSFESGDRDIAGWAALTRAMTAYYQGRISRSIELTTNGQEIAPVGTIVRAKLAAHEMRDRAKLGDADGMAQARRRATKAIAKLPSGMAPTGVFSIALSEDPPYTATSLVLLNRFQEAVSATRNVIQATYSTDTHNVNRRSSGFARALLILGLAEAGLGHVDEAAAAGRVALGSSGLVWPTLVLAGTLDQALMRDHKDAAEAANYHDLYLDMVARASSGLQHPGSALTSKEKE